MAIPNSNFSEIASVTFRKIQGEMGNKLADSVTNNNALLAKLRAGGSFQVVSDGGDFISEPLIYNSNSTSDYYSGSEVLDMSATDQVTTAKYTWKQASTQVVINGLEERQNSGVSAIVRLLQVKIQNAIDSTSNLISTGIYSDGTGSGGKQIGGLQLLVADDPTVGTVGGIDRSTQTFWRNQKQTGVTGSSDIISNMDALYVNLQRGVDRTDMIVADNNYYNFYKAALQANQRFTDASKAQSGFDTLAYENNIPVILDGGFNGSCPANHMYFLNSKYLRFAVHRDANFSMTPLEKSQNQDVKSSSILFMGNMTMNNAVLQGVLIA